MSTTSRFQRFTLLLPTILTTAIAFGVTLRETENSRLK